MLKIFFETLLNIMDPAFGIDINRIADFQVIFFIGVVLLFLGVANLGPHDQRIPIGTQIAISIILALSIFVNNTAFLIFISIVMTVCTLMKAVIGTIIGRRAGASFPYSLVVIIAIIIGEILLKYFITPYAEIVKLAIFFIGAYFIYEELWEEGFSNRYALGLAIIISLGSLIKLSGFQYFGVSIDLIQVLIRWIINNIFIITLTLGFISGLLSRR